MPSECRIGTVLVGLIALASVGCGTRVKEPLAESNQLTGQTTATAPAGSQPSGEIVGGGDGSQPAGTPAPAVPGSPTAVTSSTRVVAPGRAAQPAAGGGNGTAADRALTSGKPSAKDAPKDNGTSISPAPGTATPTVGGSPAIFGTMGTLSGPVGSSQLPTPQGAQVWVKHINSKGGLNGHVVKLLVYDDGGDPARAKTQTQQAIEQDHVIAFLANTNTLTGGTTADYITSKRVPVIGAPGGEYWVYQSPMFFPGGATSTPFFQAWVAGVAQRAAALGKTKIGTLVCVEAPDCASAQQSFSQFQSKYGYKYVYQGKASLAQPDYTAECLAARNAGVEVLWATFEAASMRRLSTACARQGYKPIYAITGQTANETILDAAATLEGTIAIANSFPYFQTGTPASDEYQQAFKAYGKGVTPGNGVTIGWTSGKIAERAGAHLSEPPTSESMLAGLWSIKNDTMGGLTYPLTYVKDQPPAQVPCWFYLILQNGAWTTPDNYRVNCA